MVLRYVTVRLNRSRSFGSAVATTLACPACLRIPARVVITFFKQLTLVPMLTHLKCGTGFSHVLESKGVRRDVDNITHQVLIGL